MEIRARYILMGLFLLAVTAGVFGFVYWLENTGGFRDRAVYRIQFDNSVSGLLTGSAVLFNGIRVGEVTALRIDPAYPRQVFVDVSVDSDTPIRNDTAVDLEYQGLTGVASISLTGGTDGAPLIAKSNQPPVLLAKAGAGLSLTTSAKDTLLKIDSILDENAKPLSQLIANLNEFSGALAKNSGKVDGIIAGLERMTGGPKGPDNDKVFDVAAAKDFKTNVKTLRGQLAVALPSALFQLDTQNILFLPSEGAAPLPAGPRWGDNVTRMVQARISQSFENAGFGGSVSQSTDAVTADLQLLTDIRKFQMVVSPKPTAEVEFFVRITDNGKIVASKLFKADVQAKSADTVPAVAALNQAFGEAASDLVDWTAGVLAPKAKAEAETPKEQPAAEASEPAPAEPKTPGSAEAPAQENTPPETGSPPSGKPAAQGSAPAPAPSPPQAEATSPASGRAANAKPPANEASPAAPAPAPN